MSQAMPSRLSKAALVAFVLGLSSIVLSLLTALPALYVGFQAIRAINSDGGGLRGRRLAIAGMVLGALTTAAAVLGGIAMILLFVQEKNHVAGCANNLRLIGLAVNNYSDGHNHFFPPGTVSNPALPPEQRLSWQTAILPFPAESGAAGKRAAQKWEKLVKEIAVKEAWDSPANARLRQNVAPYLCPAFAHDLSPDQVGLTSYVGIAGVGKDAATQPLADSHAGFFGYDRLLRAKDIEARLDATMMSIETTHENGPWPAGGPPTVRGVEPDGDSYIGKGSAFGGLHRNGTNILWVDGSVRFVTEQINPDLFRQEARIRR